MSAHYGWFFLHIKDSDIPRVEAALAPARAALAKLEEALPAVDAFMNGEEVEPYDLIALAEQDAVLGLMRQAWNGELDFIDLEDGLLGFYETVDYPAALALAQALGPARAVFLPGLWGTALVTLAQAEEAQSFIYDDYAREEDLVILGTLLPDENAEEILGLYARAYDEARKRGGAILSVSGVLM